MARARARRGVRYGSPGCFASDESGHADMGEGGCIHAERAKAVHAHDAWQDRQEAVMVHRCIQRKMAFPRVRVAGAGGVSRLAAMVALAGLLAGGMGGLGGCSAEKPKAAAKLSDEPVNSGLAALMRDSDIDVSKLPSGPPESLTDTQLAALVQRSAMDLEKVFAEQAERTNRPRAQADAANNAANSPTQPATGQPDSPAFALSDVANSAPGATPGAVPDPAAASAGGATDGAPDAAVAQGDAGTTSPATSPTDPTNTAVAGTLAADAGVAQATNPDLASLSSEDRLFVATVSRIVDLMKPTPLADGTQIPGMNEALALAAVESARPGTLGVLDDPNGVLAKGLSADRYAVLRETRDRIAQNPAAAQGAAQQALTSLAPALQMSSVRLCTRVMGFGRYDAYPNNDFAAGRPIRAIVYAQIDGFTVRPAKHADPVQPNVPIDEQKTVDLSQSLTLFHDTGTMQAWHRPFQRVMETSRDVRQDFYLIQQIELPKELPIGEYRLKVTVRDNSSGAEHEAFIPLRVVAGGPSMSDAR